MRVKLLNISIKMVLAGMIALLGAYFLGLKYYTTASAIAVLSIQWTKKDFINIAVKRIISGLLAIIFASALFVLLGQNFLVFALFLAIFITGSWLTKMETGIVPSVVIVTQFLSNKITISFATEELILLLIAIGSAFIVNFLYPQYSKKEMFDSMERVDLIIKALVSEINKKLDDQTHIIDLKQYKTTFKAAINDAKLIDKDLLFHNDSTYMTYVYMRNMQMKVLSSAIKNIENIKMTHEHTKILASFAKELHESIGYANNAAPLLVKLTELRIFFTNAKLPTTRAEFETRSSLFQILNDFETFLIIKNDFHSKYVDFLKGER